MPNVLKYFLLISFFYGNIQRRIVRGNTSISKQVFALSSSHAFEIQNVSWAPDTTSKKGIHENDK